MGKEIKVGLGIILILMIVMGVVLVRRLSRPGELPTAEFKGEQSSASSNATDIASSVDDEQPTLLEAGKDSDWMPPRQSEVKKSSEPWQSTSDTTQADEATSRRFMPADPSSSRYEFGKSSSPSKTAVGENDSPYRYDQQKTEPFRPEIHSPEDHEHDTYDQVPLPLNPAGASEPKYDDSADIPWNGSDEPSALRFSASQEESSSQQRPMNTAYQQPVNRQRQSQNYNNSWQRPPVASQPYRSRGATSPSASGFAKPQAIDPLRTRERPVARRDNTGTYYVEPGDNFWKISQKMYGSGGYFKALSAENHLAIPTSSDLRVGDEVSTPTAEELHKKYPGLCPKRRTTKPGTPRISGVSASRPGRAYLVEAGDTLFGIARYELGDGARWPEIYQLNRRTLGDDMDYLKPGTRLVLPADPSKRKSPTQREDQLTRERNNQLRR